MSLLSACIAWRNDPLNELGQHRWSQEMVGQNKLRERTEPHSPTQHAGTISDGGQGAFPNLLDSLCNYVSITKTCRCRSDASIVLHHEITEAGIDADQKIIFSSLHQKRA